MRALRRRAAWVADCSALRCHGDLAASAGTFAAGARVCDGCGDFLRCTVERPGVRVVQSRRRVSSGDIFWRASVRTLAIVNEVMLLSRSFG